jgi:hypothetical protein
VENEMPSPVPKLSAALVAACSLNIPRVEGVYFKTTPEGELCGCAVGQALIAVNIVSREEALRLTKDYPSVYGLNSHVYCSLLPAEWMHAEWMQDECGDSAAALATGYNDGEHHELGVLYAVPPLDIPTIAARLAAIGA